MKKGFTLIELLVVIVIIGILATLATVGLNSVRAKARDSKRISDVRQMQSALELYLNDNNGYPTAGAFTIGSPLVSPDGRTTYMSKIPSNPKPWAEGACTGSGADYVYTSSNTNTYQLSYCLANNVNDITAGNCTAKPGSICDAPTCNCIGKCSGQMDSCGKNSCSGPNLTAIANVLAGSDGTITWDAQADATGYTIYRNTTNNSGTATNIGTSVTNSYSDSTISVGTTYYYWVKANNTTCSVNSASFSTVVSMVATQPNCPVAICGDCSSTACGSTCSTNVSNGTSTIAETYGTVQVGTQCWMTKNITNVGKKVNGGVYSDDSTIERWCYQDATYTDWSSNCNTDGALYAWNEAMYLPASYNTTQFTGYTGIGPDPYNYTTHVGTRMQGVCPKGWHIPSDYELWYLENYTQSSIATSGVAIASDSPDYNADEMGTGGTMTWRGASSDWSTGVGAKLLCTSQYNMSWYNNSSYCTAGTYYNTTPKFPLAGIWDSSSFNYRSTYSRLWSSSQYSTGIAWGRILSASLSQSRRYINTKTFGVSVRCLKD